MYKKILDSFNKKNILHKELENEGEVVVYQYLLELNFISILFRLLFATVAVMIIGMDRSRKGRAAGVKTHILVGLGATLVRLTSQYMYVMYGVISVEEY